MTHKKFLARFAALVLALALMAMTMGCGTGMSIEYGNSDISVKVSAKSGANVEYGSVIPVEVTIKNKTDTRLGAEVFFIASQGFSPRYTEDVSLYDYNNYNKLPKHFKDSVFYTRLIDIWSNLNTLDVNITNTLADYVVQSLQMNDEDRRLLIEDITEFESLFADSPFSKLWAFANLHQALIYNNRIFEHSEYLQLTDLSLKQNNEIKYTLYIDTKSTIGYSYSIGGNNYAASVDAYLSKIGINVQAAYVGSSTNTPGIGFLDIGEMTFNVKNKAQ